MRRFKGNLLSVGKPLKFETSSSKIHIMKLSSQGVASAIPISVPYTPTDVSASEPGNSQSRVTWTAPEKNGGSVITSYIVKCSQDFTQAVSGSLTTTIFTGLTNGTSYTFTVQAINVAGASIASSPSNSVMPFSVPSAPISVSATAGNAQANISWNIPLSNGGFTIIMYRVTCNNNTIKDVSGSLTTTIFTGLTNGISYTFTVQAINIVGASIPSSPSNLVIPFSVPLAPTIGTATPGDGEVSLTWTAPSSNGGSTIIMYRVTSNNNIIKDVSGTLTSTIVSGLTNGTSYTFTVQAINVAGPSIPSSPSNSVTPIQPPAVVSLATANLDTTFPSNRVGSSLEISSDGNVICVTNCNSTSDRYIKIYRFNASTSSWNNEKTITTSFNDINGDPFEEPAGQFWGNILALSGNGNYVGIASSTNTAFGSAAGLVEVYEYNVTTQLWSRDSWLNSILTQNYNGTGPAPTSPNAAWGSSISFNYSGNVFAVGGALFNTAGIINIYKQNSNIWTLTSTIVGVGTERLGHRISLSSSGTRLIAGTIDSYVKTYVESTTNSWSIFSSPSPAIIEVTNTLSPNGTLVEMSKDGTTFIAGSNRYTGPLGSQQGLVKVYRFISNSWTQIGQELTGPSALSTFGSSLAISNTGNVIVIGAPGANSSFGSAYAYKYNSVTYYWDLLFSQTGLSTSDRLGTFMTFGMTSDATKLVLGVPNTGNGSVRIYNVAYNSSVIP